MPASLPLPPAAQIHEVIAAANELFEVSPLNTAVMMVNNSPYTYSPGTVQEGLLAVSTTSQKVIEITPEIPNNSRITIFDKTGTAGLHAIIVRPINGAMIDGSPEDVVINLNHGCIKLIKVAGLLYSIGREVISPQWMDAVVYFNNTIDEDYTIPSDSNALSVGPLIIAPDATVTVASGASWSIN